MTKTSKGPISDKSFLFALLVIKSYKGLIKKNEFVMSKQLLRSGTAIGALVRESQNAESTKDFIHKLSISLKEANESLYWIDLLYESGYIDFKEHGLLSKGASELYKMISSSIITLKKKVA